MCRDKCRQRLGKSLALCVTVRKPLARCVTVGGMRMYMQLQPIDVKLLHISRRALVIDIKEKAWHQGEEKAWHQGEASPRAQHAYPLWKCCERLLGIRLMWGNVLMIAKVIKCASAARPDIVQPTSASRQPREREKAHARARAREERDKE